MTDYAVINPATGEQVKTFPTITDEELAAAIKLAHETHQRWARTTSVEERAALVERMASRMAERGQTSLAQRYHEQVHETRQRAELIRRVLLMGGEDVPVLEDGPQGKNVSD